jgi:GNAT superfamily N-acetyltransferase
MSTTYTDQDFAIRPERRSNPMPPHTIQTLDSNEVTTAMLHEASELFTCHYAKWSVVVKPPLQPGALVRLSPKGLEKQGVFRKDDPRAAWHLVRVRVGADHIAHAFACRFKSEVIFPVAGGTGEGETIREAQVLWVTQIVVHKDYRHRGLAKKMLFDLRQHILYQTKPVDTNRHSQKDLSAGMSQDPTNKGKAKAPVTGTSAPTTRSHRHNKDKYIYGIASSHPYSILAGTRGLSTESNKGLETIDLSFVLRNRTGVLNDCPVAYLNRVASKIAKGKASCADEPAKSSSGSRVLAAGPSFCIDTAYPIDQEEPRAALARLNEKGVWPLGRLEPGMEFCVVAEMGHLDRRYYS